MTSHVRLSAPARGFAGSFTMRIISSMALAIAFSIPQAHAQATSWSWRNITPAAGPAPEPRSSGTAIYDPVGRRVVIFGGRGVRGLFNDVWAFDLFSNAWGRLETIGEPPEPRLGANAIYDRPGHRMVIWAGQQGNLFFNDTWALDLNTLEWRNLSPPPGARPQARYGAGAVFDPVERSLVQFAGFTDLSRRFDDTQAFRLDTNSWEEIGPAASGVRPEVRCLLTAALDAPLGRMIIHGGQRSGPLDDTWSFDLQTRKWTNLTPAVRPAGRMLAVSFIDQRQSQLIVFGGATAAGRTNETWSLHLVRGDWLRMDLANAPPARDSAMGAWAEDEARFIVFGGIGSGYLSDVWELRRTDGRPSQRRRAVRPSG